MYGVTYCIDTLNKVEQAYASIVEEQMSEQWVITVNSLFSIVFWESIISNRYCFCVGEIIKLVLVGDKNIAGNVKYELSV